MATQPSLRTGETPRKDSGNGPGRGRPGGNGGRVFPSSSPASSQDIHRAPPHSVEAEQGVLGSMLISPRDAIGECVEKINEEYFYVPAHRTIYNVLVDLWNAGQAIDLITFTQVLRDRNLLESVGGAAFVTSLFTFVPTAANVGYYLDIVRDKYILRQIITASTESVRRAYEEQDEVGNLLDEVEQKIFAVGEDRFKGQMLSMKDQVMEAIESIEKLYERKGGITGISTGFAEFDRMTSGMHAAEMIVIAGRPSMGKTALAMNIAEHAAIQEKLSVAVFSLEMSSQQLVQRLLCSRTRRAQDNRQLEISEISAGIKGLAKELKIPIIVVAQLNRQPEARSGGKPRLSDLRESGSIEQDADLVGLLVRPEIYEEDEDARAERAGEAELIIAKQRNGPVGEIALTFLKEFTRFEDRARNVSEPEEAF